MNYSAKNLIAILVRRGYYFKRANGSHQLYYNPKTGKTVIVPIHGNKDLAKGTFFAILKQAGIDKMTFNCGIWVRKAPNRMAKKMTGSNCPVAMASKIFQTMCFRDSISF